jgi:hypothetical protein
MPLDIVHDKQRLKAVQEGLKKALTSGLYAKVSNLGYKDGFQN